MATFTQCEDMEIWKKARVLVNDIYRHTETIRDYAFVKQARTAALSAFGNIGEGFERDGNNEFVQFLSIAKGSAGELKCYLYTALDQGYIDRTKFEKLLLQTKELIKETGGFISYLKKSGYKGWKLKKEKKAV